MVEVMLAGTILVVGFIGLMEAVTMGGEMLANARKQKLAEQIKLGSLCALGQTAPNPVLTTLRYFMNEYTEHIEKKKCRALVCPDMLSYYILPDKCQGCGICASVCPRKATPPHKVTTLMLPTARAKRRNSWVT